MFRQEAIDFERQHRQGGQVALLQPLPTKIITWLVAVSVGCIIIFLFLGQYARKETVVGFLAPTSGVAKIFATRPGTIKDIYVKEGEEVKKGQPLLAVETSQIAVTGQDINAGMLAPLEWQQTSLKDQIAAEQERMKSEHARLSATAAGLETEISEVRAQIETQQEQFRLSSEFVSSVAGLAARGIVSDLDYKKRQVAALEQKEKLDSLNQQLAARQNQLTEARFSLEQLPTVTAGKIQSLWFSRFSGKDYDCI
jgi:membrane fusion protein